METQIELTESNKPVELILSELHEKYKDNQYMLNRLHMYLTNLPSMLDVENKKYEERLSRINELTMEQDNFYKVFLIKHQYFYMPYNNIYYDYDGKTYTIQNVLGFLQTIFETKMEAKYFLTIIGDCILKKNVGDKPLMYFINANTKKLVLMIDSIAYITTGNSIMSNFISKYHDTHDLSCYRLIKTNENPISSEIIKDMLNKIGIDLLCVATHYSDRYSNSDNFLLLESDETNNKYSMFFVNNTIDKIVTDFIKQCLDVSTNSNNNSNTAIQSENGLLGINAMKYSLSWKNMHYIWKQYLSTINIPNMLYTNSLKDLLKGKLICNTMNSASVNNETSNNIDIIFKNITSKFLPSVSSFISFWEKYITILDNETNANGFDDEYEVDEIMSLYKSSEFKNVSISEKEIIKMINHYFSPQIEVIDNKYITNIRCNLWIKHEDIRIHLITYKTTMQISSENSNNKELISFDELYKGYKSYCTAKHIVDKCMSPIVSKQFFEKFLLHELNSYIKFDKFVSSEWINDK